MNKTTNTKKRAFNKNLKPFIAPDSTIKITQDDIEKRKRRIAKAEEIGQSITRVDSDDSGHENPYRVQALCYIMQDLEVPTELKKKIKEFDEKHEALMRNTKTIK